MFDFSRKALTGDLTGLAPPGAAGHISVGALPVEAAFTEFLSKLVQDGMVMTSPDVAIAPAIPKLWELREDLAKFLESQEHGAVLALSFKPKPGSEGFDGDSEDLRSDIGSSIKSAIADPDQRFGRGLSDGLGQYDFVPQLVEGILDLALATLASVTKSGLNAKSIDVGFTMFPSKVLSVGPANFWHRYGEFSNEKVSGIDFTSISVPVGPTTVNGTRNNVQLEKIPTYFELVELMSESGEDQLLWARSLFKRILQFEQGNHPSIGNLWSPLPESTLLFAPQAIHQAPNGMICRFGTDPEELARRILKELQPPRAAFNVTVVATDPAANL